MEWDGEGVHKVHKRGRERRSSSCFWIFIFFIPYIFHLTPLLHFIHPTPSPHCIHPIPPLFPTLSISHLLSTISIPLHLIHPILLTPPSHLVYPNPFPHLMLLCTLLPPFYFMHPGPTHLPHLIPSSSFISVSYYWYYKCLLLIHWYMQQALQVDAFTYSFPRYYFYFVTRCKACLWCFWHDRF